MSKDVMQSDTREGTCDQNINNKKRSFNDKYFLFNLPVLGI